MKLALWEHPERNLEKQTLNFWQNAGTLTGDLHQAITVTFLSLLMGGNAGLLKKPVETVPIIIVLRLLSKKILIFLQMWTQLAQPLTLYAYYQAGPRFLFFF